MPLAEPVAPDASPQPTPVAPGGMVTLSIKVPPGCQPGQIIAVDHGGQRIQVACPPGVPPGGTFQVQVPATPAAQPVTT